MGVGGKEQPYGQSFDSSKQRDIDVLVRLLPYYDTDLTLRNKENDDAKKLRALLAISRSEADNLFKRKGISTLHQLMNKYFDSLLVPDTQEYLIKDLEPCFYQQRERVRVFLSTLHRLVWEYNFVNQMFVKQYRMLHEKQFVDPDTGLTIYDIFIFGGAYAFSRGQIRAIIEIASKNEAQIRGLTLNFTRIQNHGVIQLCESINAFKSRAVRLFDKNLYSLDLTNNFIDHKGVEILCSSLFKTGQRSLEQIAIQQDGPNTKYINENHKVQEEDVPLSTSIRILILDYNFLDVESMNALAKVILTQRQVRLLSLSSCRLTGDELLAFTEVGLSRARHLVYLDLS